MNNCPSLQLLGYGEFSQYFHNLVGSQRIPVNVSMEVTMRCNLRCEHCYLPFAIRSAAHPSELTLVEYQRLFSEFADAGVFWLLITGGEPFLRPDFLDIYDDAKRRGFIISLFTNGTLITDAIADYLAEYRPFDIEISLYGATQATYERVTGVPGSFKRCLRGIELLLERDLPLKLKSPIITLNQHEYQDLKALTESFGLDFHFDAVIQTGIYGDSYPTQFRLTPDQVVDLECHDPGKAKAWPDVYRERLSIKKEKNNLYTCGAGRYGFHMDAFGQVSLCLSARSPSYDLRAGTLKQAWEEFFPPILDLEYSQDFACKDCELRTVCMQCPQMGLIERGNFEEAVPYLCELAHKRQQIFDPECVYSKL